MKVAVKTGTDHSTEFIDVKANFFGEHRETEMVVAQELNVEIQSTTSQTRLEGEGHRIHR
jgi:hypothetical protein